MEHSGLIKPSGPWMTRRAFLPALGLPLSASAWLRRLTPAALTGLALPHAGHAAGVGFIRDSEIENLLRLYAGPLFAAQGYKTRQIGLYIINNPNANAFVANGLNMFVHTGLLTTARHYSEILGVLAHELGHIVGGHLTRLRGASENAALSGLLATALAVPLSVVTLNPAVLGAGVLAGQTVGQRTFLAYTRQFEQAADQVAVETLAAIGESSQGLLTFMTLLRDLEGGRGGSPYTRTHPLTSERIAFFEQHANRQSTTERPGWQLALLRSQAKIIGYTWSLEDILRFFPEQNQSVQALYARAFGYMRAGRTAEALRSLEPLLGAFSEDPFIHEAHGDIFRTGRQGRAALEAYQKALTFFPQGALIRGSAARVALDLRDPALLPSVSESLYRALAVEENSAYLWDLMGETQYNMSHRGLSMYARTRAAFLRRDVHKARALGARAKELLEPVSHEYQEIESLLVELDKEA